MSKEHALDKLKIIMFLFPAINLSVSVSMMLHARLHRQTATLLFLQINFVDNIF